MINPGAISAGALSHVQNPNTWKQGSSGEKPPSGNEINRPKIVTAIAVCLLLIAAYGAVMTFRNWEFVSDFLFHIATIGFLIYCGLGFLSLKKKSLEVFFWMIGITTIVRWVGLYHYCQTVVGTELNLSIMGEVVNLAVIVPVCIYLANKEDLFKN